MVFQLDCSCMNDQAYYDICWDRYNNVDNEESWRGGQDKEQNRILAERGEKIICCDGCGEDWQVDDQADPIEWCKKCPWEKDEW